jgi:hypothetical protein
LAVSRITVSMATAGVAEPLVHHRRALVRREARQVLCGGYLSGGVPPVRRHRVPADGLGASGNLAGRRRRRLGVAVA